MMGHETAIYLVVANGRKLYAMFTDRKMQIDHIVAPGMRKMVSSCNRGE